MYYLNKERFSEYMKERERAKGGIFKTTSTYMVLHRFLLFFVFDLTKGFFIYAFAIIIFIINRRIEMKKLLETLGTILFGVYILGTMIATPYYTWQDISKHDSFIRYIFVSPIVGFVNSAIWPYNLYVDNIKAKNNLTPIQKANVKSFFFAEEQLRSAITLGRSITNSKDIKGDFEKVDTLLTDAKNRMLECDREVLNTLYPGWGDIALDTFVKAVGYYKSGMSKDGDRADLPRGDALLVKYESWIKDNWKEMGKKLSNE